MSLNSRAERVSILEDLEAAAARLNLSDTSSEHLTALTEDREGLSDAAQPTHILPVIRTCSPPAVADSVYTSNGLSLPVNRLYRPFTPPPSLLPLPDPQTPNRNRSFTSSSASRRIDVRNSSRQPFGTPRSSTVHHTSSHTHPSQPSTPSRSAPTSARNNSSTPSRSTSRPMTPVATPSRSVHHPSRMMETPGRTKNKFYVVVVGRRTGVFDDW